MGRIKTKKIMTLSQDILEKHSDNFTTDFSQNKNILRKLVHFPTKKPLNVVAGYITRVKKAKNE